MGKQYRDAVYGSVVLDELQSDLLGCRAVQDTQHKFQLGLGGLLYRCAEGSRLPHIMGAGVLARTFAEHLGFSQLENDTTVAAANLHDVSQFGLGHAVDTYFLKKWGVTHEELSSRAIQDDPEIRGVLSKHGVDSKLVAHLVSDTDFLRTYQGNWRFAKQLVAGSVDVDRIDFLLRDARSTAQMGLAVDYNRLIQCAGRARDECYGDILFYDEEALPTLQAFFGARHGMYQSVYYNPQSQKREILLNKALFMMDDYIKARFSHHCDDPSKIRGQDMIDALVECDDSRYGVARELLNVVFNGGPVFEAAFLRQGFDSDKALLGSMRCSFMDAGSLEGHLRSVVGGREGEVVVFMEEGEPILSLDDVFIRTRDSGFEGQKILPADKFLKLGSYAPCDRKHHSLRVFTIREKYVPQIRTELLSLVT